jgi:Flp pilus assembly protein TadB
VGVLGRKKTAEEQAPSAVVDYAERPGAKNRPTPKRREQEAARKRPLVPTDRKAAAKSDRAQARLERVRQREAMANGDESALPPRDRGPVKRFIRDQVDRRRSMGEFMLPVMIVVLALSFLAGSIPWAMTVVFVLIYGLVLIGVVDAFLLWRRIKRAVVDRFGEEPPRGSAMYAVMRAFQMRRARMPRPQIERGAEPR